MHKRLIQIAIIIIQLAIFLVTHQVAHAQSQNRIYTPVNTFDFTGTSNCASGWTFDNGDNTSQLICYGSHIGIQDITQYTRKSGLLWRNNIFASTGNLAIEVRFRYPSYTGYGVDAYKLHAGQYFGGRICNNGLPYVGDPDCPTWPSAEIAGSHGTGGGTGIPHRSSKVLIGSDWQGWEENGYQPSMTNWMVSRLEYNETTRLWDVFAYPNGCTNGGADPCERTQPAEGSYTLPNGVARPEGIHIGHHIIMKPGWQPGPWTNVEVDYIKTWSWVESVITPTPTPTATPTPSPTPTPTPPPFNIQGSVFERTSGSTQCGFQTGDTPISGFQVRLAGVANPPRTTTTTSTNNNFIFNNVSWNPTPNGYILTNLMTPPGFTAICNTSRSFSYTSGTYDLSTHTSGDFIVTRNRGPWWQSAFGDLHAPNSIQTQIPNTCITPSCNPYLSINTANKHPGIPIVTNGNINTGFGNISQLPQPFQASSPMSYDQPQLREDYDYFAALVNLGPNTATTITNLDNLPTQSGIYYLANPQYITSTLDASVIGSNKVIIFVNGNLNINNSITGLPSSGFLAFIVNGDINISNNLGSPNAPGSIDPFNASANLEGVYIADQVLDFGSGPNLLVVEGIFVGWEGIDNSRNLSSESNNTSPSFVARYNPNLLLNTPLQLKSYNYIWKEAIPKVLPAPTP